MTKRIRWTYSLYAALAPEDAAESYGDLNTVYGAVARQWTASNRSPAARLGPLCWSLGAALRQGQDR